MSDCSWRRPTRWLMRIRLSSTLCRSNLYSYQEVSSLTYIFNRCIPTLIDSKRCYIAAMSTELFEKSTKSRCSPEGTHLHKKTKEPASATWIIIRQRESSTHAPNTVNQAAVPPSGTGGGPVTGSADEAGWTSTVSSAFAVCGLEASPIVALAVDLAIEGARELRAYS